MRFFIPVHTGLCQDELFQVKHILVSVHHWLTVTRFVLGCCSTLLARVKAAESQRPKGALVRTETILLNPSPDAPLGGGCFAVGAGLTAGAGGAGLAGAGGAGASSAGETSSVIGPPGSLNSHSNAV